MTKAVLFPIPLILVLATAVSPAQTSTSYQSTAVANAVMRQADTIDLRHKLDQANAALQQKDLVAAAKLYEEAWTLVQQIGSGIPEETAQTKAGLVYVHMELAREAEREGNLHDADVQVSRVLIVDPQNPEAIAFKKQNDALIAETRGKAADLETQAQVPAIQNQQTDAATLARDGQLLYEMGNLDEAQLKLEQALQLDPDNEGAYYYLNLVKEARYKREEHHKDLDDADRMVQVERSWEKPVNIVTNMSNPYAQTNVNYVGPGREEIYSKLNRIRLDKVDYSQLPLSEVLHQLIGQSQLRDPDKQGINFLFNPNIENIPATATTIPGEGGRPGAPAAIDPATGLPVGQPAAPQTADATAINISLQLNNVSLADLLDAICMVSDHPIKYSVEEYGIVFSQKGADSPQYEMRDFKVDPNTFYAGLQNVSSFLFGSVNITSGQGGGGGGGGGGGQGGGANGNSVSGAVVPVVNVAPGAGAARSSGGGGRGGGGGQVGATGGNTGGGGEGAGGVLQNPLADLGANVQDPNGGLLYVTTPNLTRDVSALAKQFFSSLGVNLDAPKTLFFNDRLGVLFVYATPQDLDIIQRAIQVLNQVPPQVHIKARFINVVQQDASGLGFDWYLGQFSIGGVAQGQGGQAGTLNVQPTSANPSGTFPGNSVVGTVAPGLPSLTSGLTGNNSSIPSIASITGILTNPNFQVVLHALQSRIDTTELAEPEVTTISGRQTQMRATTIQPVVTGFTFQSAPATAAATGAVP